MLRCWGANPHAKLAARPCPRPATAPAKLCARLCMLRLDKVGYDVGARLLELLSYREKALRRKPEVSRELHR